MATPKRPYFYNRIHQGQHGSQTYSRAGTSGIRPDHERLCDTTDGSNKSVKDITEEVVLGVKKKPRTTGSYKENHQEAEVKKSEKEQSLSRSKEELHAERIRLVNKQLSEHFRKKKVCFENGNCQYTGLDSSASATPSEKAKKGTVKLILQRVKEIS